jgi:hypothetical protein
LYEIHRDALMHVPAARQALIRETGIPMERLPACALALADQLHFATLRHHPDAVRIAGEVGGEKAEMRCLQYLAGVGFPTRRPAIHHGEHGGRRTPAEVRSLWTMCHDAVSLVRHQFCLEPHEVQGVTLSLSWFLHEAAMSKYAWYRKRIRAECEPHAPGAIWDAYEFRSRANVATIDDSSSPAPGFRGT